MSVSRVFTTVLVTCCSLLLIAFSAAWAQDQQPRPRESCRDVERQYDVVKAGATTLQTNITLFAAADSGCEALARRLLAAGASLQARDRLGAMPLAHAARAGQLRLTRLFLDQGAPIDARNIVGTTALLGAAENERPGTVALLLSKGADPNLPGHSGITPLIAAAFKGNDRIVEALLARQAEPNAVDSTGKAAITYAAARGFVEIVRRLLDAGVDARQRYGNDLTALIWAAGHEDGVNAGAAEAVVELLLARGAPLDAADNRGRTALMTAAELGRAALVDVLLRHGADRDLRDKAGKTALQLAADPRVREALEAK
jgi:ankyrin repeat protein